MDDYIAKDFFRIYGSPPLRVIPMDEIIDVNWEMISMHYPLLPRAWYELAQLSPEDRIDFHRDFWISKIPYQPYLDRQITKFFDSLNDIAVYLVQQSEDLPCEPFLIYMRKGNTGYFRGALPAQEDQLLFLEEEFSSFIFPEDYLAFLQIHNGFWKATDTTGLIPVEKMPSNFRKFQKLLEDQGVPTTCKGDPVDPSTLIPFYESFGMPYYQCFWTTWYPVEEMGNVYYSSESNTIDIPEMKSKPAGDNLSFASFLDWLMFYVEKIT
ncbi:MAG: SMI1/KNR4 family protein [Waddliaceae bacterium]